MNNRSLFLHLINRRRGSPLLGVSPSPANWVSLLATAEEIAAWNTRKTTGPFATSGDFDNGNATDAANPGEYDLMAAAFGSTWSSSHWSGPTNFSVEGYVARDSVGSNDPPSSVRAQAMDMLGASYKALMDDAVTPGSANAEATAIMTELLAYATQANLDYGDEALWPKLSSGYYDDVNPLFFHCLWVAMMVPTYSNVAALVGRNTTIEAWFSDLAYLAEHELHNNLSKAFPNRKSDDYTTGRWSGVGWDGDTTVSTTGWGDEADGTDVTGMSFQLWYNNRRIDQAALVLLVGALLDDATLIAEGERFVREWMGFGINVTTGSHPDFNRATTSLPQLDISYHWGSWRFLMHAIDAAYRKGYTTAATQTTSLGTTHATWGTAKTDKTLAECLGVMASWVDESISPQVYAPMNGGYAGNAAYRRAPVTPSGAMYYTEGWLTRAAAMFGQSSWRDAVRRVGTPEGFDANIQNDGGVTGARTGFWERFLDPWDVRTSIYGSGPLIMPVLEILTLLGYGSASTSLVDYPKIADQTTGDKYVDASVASSGDGNSLATAYKTLPEGLAAITSGQRLIVKGGTYNVGSGIVRSTAWAAPTYVMAYGSDTVILDGSNVPYDGRTLRFLGAVNEVWHGFHVRNQNAGGANGGQSVAFTDNAHDCKLSRFWVSHCAKDGIWGYNAYNIQVLDSAVWRLGDGVTTGTNAPDTYAITGDANSGLQGIRYVRCFSAHAGDDGFDFYRNQGAKAIDCVSFGAGYYWNGTPSGDGNAFKAGSGEANTHSNEVSGSLAIGAKNNGFDDNATDANNTYVRNTAVNCGEYGFQAGSGLSTTVHDNIGIGNGTLDYKEWAAIGDSHNSWNLGITNPQFGNPSLFDWSLLTGSPALGAGIAGGNLGASTIALEIAKEWLAKDLT